MDSNAQTASGNVESTASNGEASAPAPMPPSSLPSPSFESGPDPPSQLAGRVPGDVPVSIADQSMEERRSRMLPARMRGTVRRNRRLTLSLFLPTACPFGRRRERQGPRLQRLQRGASPPPPPPHIHLDDSLRSEQRSRRGSWGHPRGALPRFLPCLRPLG
jgi:hypothetical protein